MRVLIAPDKFKGSLTARAAAEAIAEGWRRARPGDHLELLPMSDGGDGFGEIMSRLLGAAPQPAATMDAAHRPCKSVWWWEPRSKTAVVESARVIGLAMLPRGKFHPFDLDTAGLGVVMKAAATKGARRCLIGIGGSATNDAGFGMARALGWKFLDQEDRAIERWTDLPRLSRIVRPGTWPFQRMKTTVAVDVQNPLLGPRGCSRVYGPQKGLRREDLPLADAALNRLAAVARNHFGKNHALTPGAGAAGGLGFGLFAFLDAQARPGFELFARHARLERRLRAADLVITGEGAIDRSTLMGKGVGEIARRCRKRRVPCIGLAGVLNDRALLERRFTGAHCLAPEMTSPKNARANAELWLRRLAGCVAAKWPDRHIGSGRLP